jgi:hypothetical protein
MKGIQRARKKGELKRRDTYNHIGDELPNQAP